MKRFAVAIIHIKADKNLLVERLMINILLIYVLFIVTKSFHLDCKIYWLSTLLFQVLFWSF